MPIPFKFQILCNKKNIEIEIKKNDRNFSKFDLFIMIIFFLKFIKIKIIEKNRYILKNNSIFNPEIETIKLK